MKIIYILNHSYRGKWPPPEPLHRVDTLNRRFALGMRKYTEDYEIECWKPEKRIKNTICIHEDGITYKIFPAASTAFPYKHFSLPMLKAVQQEIKKHNCLLFIHGVHGKWTNLIPLWAKDVPVIVQHHGEDITYHFKNYLSKPWRLILEFLERHAMKNVDHFFMLYTEAKEKLSRYVPTEKISIQTSGIDFNLFKPIMKEEAKNKTGLNSKCRYLLYVGMLENRKGIDLLLKAMPLVIKKYPDFQLLIIGSFVRKEYEKVLQSITCQLGITSWIKFLGEIANEKLSLYYNSSELLILPSIKAEGVPKVLMEAAACNLPFIATSVGGIPEFIKEVGGILIEPGSPEKIAEAINNYLASPHPELNFREKAKRFSWDNIISSIDKIIQELKTRYYGNSL